MATQTVKCPICHKELRIPQDAMAEFRTCSIPCRDKRLGMLARRRYLLRSRHVAL